MPTLQNPFDGRILYGADYNPDQWLHEPAVLEEDIKLMKEIGVTSASIGIFSWTMLEPEEGRFEFEWLDETMDRFAAAGLKVFLATPSGSKPMWMSEAYPEIRRVSAMGVRDASGGRHNHCLTSPVYRQKTALINRELARRYGNHPALALWHIGNEFSGECHCDLCRAAFHEWLKERYGDLESLNRAWWSAFWNHTFTAWDQIPTHDASIDGLGVDWLRFINDQHVSFLENEIAPLREFSPHIPVTTNLMGANRPTNYWQWAKVVDFVSNDLYPLHDDRVDSWRKSLSSDFTHSLMRGLGGGKPWILMECSPSSVNWGRINKLKRPGVHLQETLQAVAHGADAVHYFQWRKSRGGYEKYHGAVVDHAGGPGTRVFQDCADVGKWLQVLAPLSGHGTEKAPVAILYDWESRWALETSIGPKRVGGNAKHNGHQLYPNSCHEHYRGLRVAGVDADIVSTETDFSAYQVIVTPALYQVSEELAQRLNAYVREGGVWLATYLTGYVDPSNLCWPGGFPGAGLREVFGIWNEEVDYLDDDESVDVKGHFWGAEERRFSATDVVEVIHAEGARVLAETASEFYAGSPLVTENLYGAGRAIYLGARFDQDAYQYIYRALARELNLPREELPEGVFVKVRQGPLGPVRFLFNYLRKEVKIDLRKTRYQRLADGAFCSGESILRPYDTLISVSDC